VIEPDPEPTTVPRTELERHHFVTRAVVLSPLLNRNALTPAHHIEVSCAHRICDRAGNHHVNGLQVAVDVFTVNAHCSEPLQVHLQPQTLRGLATAASPVTGLCRRCRLFTPRSGFASGGRPGMTSPGYPSPIARGIAAAEPRVELASRRISLKLTDGEVVPACTDVARLSPQAQYASDQSSLTVSTLTGWTSKTARFAQKRLRP
jgi:hypothetical protein